MKSPILINLLDYWEGLRAGRIAPLRAEVDPREIETVLDHAFILEQTATDNIRFRLAGMDLCDRMGIEVRGMPAKTLIQMADRPKYDAILAGLFSDPKIIELGLVAKRAGFSDLKAEMLLLPMKGDTGKITRILGAIAINGPKVVLLSKFSIASTKVTRIITEASSARPEMAHGFAEALAPFEPADKKKQAANKPPAFLRIIK